MPSYLVPLGTKQVGAVQRHHSIFLFKQNMVTAPCCEKTGLKKGPWTPKEDQILVNHIRRHGHANWRALPKEAGQ